VISCLFYDHRWPCEDDEEEDATHRFKVFIPEMSVVQSEDQLENDQVNSEGSQKKPRKSLGLTQKGVLFYAYNNQVHDAIGSLRRIDPSQPVYKAMPVTYLGKTTNIDVKAVDWLAPVGTPLFYCHGRTPSTTIYFLCGGMSALLTLSGTSYQFSLSNLQNKWLLS
jgi:hypothetical protein